MTSFIVMDVLERAQEMERAGESVIHLEVGEPDFNTPEAVRNSAIEALSRGDTHYTHSLGTPALREAICNYYAQTYGLHNIGPDQVIVTSGTSPAFLIAMSAILECGEEVILSNPHYACHPNFVRFLEAVPKMIPVHEEDGFQYRPESIRAALTPRTKAILINSPANPTGNLLEADRMAEIADIGRLILSDEIYHGLVYEGRARSVLEFTENCIVFNGFSKLFAMTGWRLGYLIAPRHMIRPIQKMVQNFFISANSVAQAAGYTALTDPSVREEVAKMLETYNQRRQYMIPRLREIGFGITVEPTGAFYVFANAHRFTDDSYSFAFEILENAKVGITPGVDFGSNAEGYVRFSYANSLENIKEGLNRIERYLKERR
jgi:aspartate/methionine/tyrosine aminotransferase